MKDKKVPIGADGRLIDHHASFSFDVGSGADWDDFSLQGFDDGDESSQIGNLEEYERNYVKGGIDLDSPIDLTGDDDE